MNTNTLIKLLDLLKTIDVTDDIFYDFIYELNKNQHHPRVLFEYLNENLDNSKIVMVVLRALTIHMYSKDIITQDEYFDLLEGLLLGHPDPEVRDEVASCSPDLLPEGMSVELLNKSLETEEHPNVRESVKESLNFHNRIDEDINLTNKDRWF